MSVVRKQQHCRRCGLLRKGHVCRAVQDSHGIWYVPNHDASDDDDDGKADESNSDSDVIMFDFDGPYKESYLPNYLDAAGQTGFSDLASAQEYCWKSGGGGVTQEGALFTVREKAYLGHSYTGEISWINNDAPETAHRRATKAPRTTAASTAVSIPADIPIHRVMSLLKADVEVQRKLDAAAWATLDKFFAKYNVGVITLGVFVQRLCGIVGKSKVVNLIKAAKAGATGTPVAHASANPSSNSAAGASATSTSSTASSTSAAPASASTLMSSSGLPSSYKVILESGLHANQKVSIEWEDGHTYDLSSASYINTNQWQPYDDVTKRKIIDSVLQGDTCLMVSLTGVDSHKIDLLAMKQIKLQSGFVRKIRIQPLAQTTSSAASVLGKQFVSKVRAISFFGSSPLTWSEFSETFILPVTRSFTYDGTTIMPSFCREVAKKFVETLYQGGTFQTDIITSDYSLTSVEERFDSMQWDAYQMKKKHMASQLGGEDKVNEMWLWHGTSPSSIRSLLINGFERNLGSRMAWGDGTYFAINSSYSFHESFAKVEKNAKGRDEKVLILARVLVGATCQGSPGKRTPDTRSDGTFCNSMTNNMQNPEMYILSAGSDSQSYIQFVIRFEK